jgi:hypothetical protein
LTACRRADVELQEERSVGQRALARRHDLKPEVEQSADEVGTGSMFRAEAHYDLRGHASLCQIQQTGDSALGGTSAWLATFGGHETSEERLLCNLPHTDKAYRSARVVPLERPKLDGRDFPKKPQARSVEPSPAHCTRGRAQTAILVISTLALAADGKAGVLESLCGLSSH